MFDRSRRGLAAPDEKKILRCFEDAHRLEEVATIVKGSAGEDCIPLTGLVGCEKITVCRPARFEFY